jgi:two-component system, chemotaxis family, sensor kinase CheA
MTDEQRLFIGDAQEIVEKLESDLEQLRAVRLEGRRRRQLAAQIFRRVHTLKGSAAALGFRAVGDIAHQFEAVLDGARLGRLELTGDVLDTFDEAVAAVEAALQAPGQTLDCHQVAQRLASYAQSSKSQGVIASGLRTALPEEIAASLSEYDLQHAREAVREGAKLFIVSAEFEIGGFDRDFRELTRLLGQAGEVIATMPGGPASDNGISFRILYAADFMSGELLRQAASLSQVDYDEIKVEMAPATRPGSEAGQSPAVAADGIERSTIRVDLPLLDDLIANASELFRQTANAITRGSVAGATAESSLTDLRMRFVAFEERLIRLRLVPASQAFQRAVARAGRIAARNLGNQVEFRIEGTEVGIEKALADLISDPLLHLLRNAIIHGIETPEERLSAGKKSVGRITLAAANHSGRIHITVRDDGRGIDVARVAATAAEQGISSKALSEDQCLRLIFRPGFSTSREISDIAGRGIGLDVVDRAMDIAGGEVRVSTERGKGTTFAMIVPAALSLVNCVIVRCQDRVYAIDAGQVQEPLMPAQPGDAIDGQNLPLVHLNTLIDQAIHEDNAARSLVWRRPAESKSAAAVVGYRIGVDEILAVQETLVRGLGRHAYRWLGICGAAELFDGTVALVLDLPELIRTTLETAS